MWLDQPAIYATHRPGEPSKETQKKEIKLIEPIIVKSYAVETWDPARGGVTNRYILVSALYFFCFFFCSYLLPMHT